jgi:parallel beta helix pectate lyase-like protein
MTRFVLPLTRAIIIIPMLHATAQALTVATPQTRTYVSGTGSDSNPCSASQPCKTLQVALSLTVAGGEIYVLNSANYGPVTISKAVTITGEGAVAGVLATGSAAITISASANDVINLRGLDIDGGNAGGIGIQFNSGQSLNIQKSQIRNFTNSGINFTPSGTSTLFVSDTVVTHNGSNGILITNSATGALSRVTASGNGGIGVAASGANTGVTVTDTVASNNNYGIGASSSTVMVRNSMISNNAVGVAADQSATVRVTQSTITGNGTGWQATNGGQLLTYGNNNVGGNTINGTATTTLALE